jgi:hypothetical protein
MTNILVIGDIVCVKTGQDMVIGFTPDDKVILESGGISDTERFDVIGNYDNAEDTVSLHYSDRPINMDVIRRCGGFREYANEVAIGPIL